MNNHLTKIEKEIYLSIKYGDPDKLKDIMEQIDMNFLIEVERDQFFLPVHLAAARGETECMEVLLKS